MGDGQEDGWGQDSAGDGWGDGGGEAEGEGWEEDGGDWGSLEEPLQPEKVQETPGLDWGPGVNQVRLSPSCTKLHKADITPICTWLQGAKSQGAFSPVTSNTSWDTGDWGEVSTVYCSTV